MGLGKAIFKGGIKFSASESRNNLDSTASLVQIEEDWSASTSTQEHQKMEVELKHKVK